MFAKISVFNVAGSPTQLLFIIWPLVKRDASCKSSLVSDSKLLVLASLIELDSILIQLDSILIELDSILLVVGLILIELDSKLLVLASILIEFDSRSNITILHAIVLHMHLFLIYFDNERYLILY